MRVLVVLAAAALLPAQIARITVKENDAALRARCAETGPEVAKLKQGDPVWVRFALTQGDRTCYAVTVEADGQELNGYLWAEALAGIEAFEQGRRKASAEAAAAAAARPLVARGGARAPRERSRTPAREAPPVPMAPEFSVASLESPGRSFNNESLRGKMYLIDFWATWCGPCRSEMPHLHDTYNKYKDRNFEILSVSLDEKPDDVARYRQGKWKMPWQHAHAGAGFGSDAPRRFGVTGIPAGFLVDPYGRIIARGNALRGASLERTLEQMLAAQSH